MTYHITRYQAIKFSIMLYTITSTPYGTIQLYCMALNCALTQKGAMQYVATPYDLTGSHGIHYNSPEKCCCSRRLRKGTNDQGHREGQGQMALGAQGPRGLKVQGASRSKGPHNIKFLKGWGPHKVYQQ